jgi:hypothetical protein
MALGRHLVAALVCSPSWAVSLAAQDSAFPCADTK